MIKNSFSEFEGNNGAKSADGNVSSQALSACLVKANCSDVPPRNCCISGQLCCSAAISSKSSGSAADMAAIDPVVVWFGGTKNQQQHFSNRVNTTTAC
jgi:hypothetical protein